MEKNMNRVMTLLNEKNHYLEKFYTVNESELANFANGNFDNLQQLYYSREKILEVLKYVDAQLEKSYSEIGIIFSKSMVEDVEISAETRSLIEEAFAIKDMFVARIIEQDIQILVEIEGAKNSIIKELQETKKNRKGLSGYKVNTFTKTIDEEV